METPQPLQTTPTLGTPPKKSGCGCWLWGCGTLFALLIVTVIGAVVALKFATDFVVSDRFVLWSYENIAKPKIEAMLPPTMSTAQKKRVLAQTDAALKEFIALPAEEKAEMKKEVLTALYYLSQDQVVPPEKIPHLAKFIDKYIQEFQEPADSPRLIQ